MTIPTKNFIWQQGEDGEIPLRYSVVINDVKTYVDLTDYSLRMDIVGTDANYSLNSEDENPSTVDEVTLNDGGVLGAIRIVVPRAASIDTGTLTPGVGEALAYDIFLRNPEGLQKKIMRGTIIIEASTTIWP